MHVLNGQAHSPQKTLFSVPTFCALASQYSLRNQDLGTGSIVSWNYRVLRITGLKCLDGGVQILPVDQRAVPVVILPVS